MNQPILVINLGDLVGIAFALLSLLVVGLYVLVDKVRERRRAKSSKGI